MSRRLPGVLGLILFCIAIFLITGLAARSIYGFPARIGSIRLVEVLSDLTPILAMLCALLVLPVAMPAGMMIPAGGARRYWLLHHRASALLTAVLFGLIMLIAGATMIARGVDVPDLARPKTLFGLLVDLFLVVSLANLILLWTGKRLVAIGAMFAYSLVIVLVAQPLGIVQRVGFGTTPHQVITPYASWPLGFAEIWAWRGYWFTILLALGLIVAWRRSTLSRGAAITLTGGAAGLFVLAAIAGAATNTASLTQERRLATPGGTLPAGYAALKERPTARRFRIAVTMRRAGGAIIVSGRLVLVNQTAAPLGRVLLEKSPLLELDRMTGPTAVSEWRSPDRRLIGMRLAKPLAPGQGTELFFHGRIDQPGFGFPATERFLMTDGVFLTPALLLPLPRSAACAVPAGTLKQACGPGENYLLGDPATGEVTVAPPPGWTVAGASRAPGGDAFRITVDDHQWGNFALIAAPFRTGTYAAAAHCPGLDLYLAPRSHIDATALADSVCREWRTLARDYGDGGLNRFWVAEVPDHIALGQSLRSGVMLSDRLLEEGADSAIVRHVLAHEIAHRIWGYDVLPEKGPGLQLVLEALPQYIAFTKDNDGRSPTAMARQLAAVRAEQGGPPVDKKLWQSDNLADAYLSQPRALLLVDTRSGGQLRKALADSYRELALQPQRCVAPIKIIMRVRGHLSPPAVAMFDDELKIASGELRSEEADDCSEPPY